MKKPKLPLSWLNANLLGTLPVFLATNIAAVLVWILNISSHTMPLILGIVAGGLVDLDNRLTGRLKNLFFTLIAFTISSLSAQLALSDGWIFIALITLIAFIVVMLGAIGQRYSTIAFGTLLVAVYTTLTYTPNASWYGNTLLILSGTLLYGLIAVFVHLCFPHRTVQENLALYYQALGDYLETKSTFFDPDDSDSLPSKQLALAKANIAVMQTLDKARVSLFYRLRGQHRHLRTQRMLRFYFAGQEIWERASSSYAQYHTLFTQLQNSDLFFRLQRILALQAQACQQIATAIRADQPYQHNPKGEKTLQGLAKSLRYHQKQNEQPLYKLQSIAENLTNIERQLAQLEHFSFEQNARKNARLIAENVSGWTNMWQAVKNQCHFSSPLFRHAVRLSLVVLLSSLIAETFRIEQGYWILLTAVLVCQPNYSATKKRLVQRIVGTVLGVLVGLSFRYLSPTLEAQLGILVASSSLFFFFRTNNYSFSTFFITIQVLISFDITGLELNDAMLPRIWDTLIGALIAWCGVAYFFPDWKYLNLHQSLQDTLRTSALYLRHIIAQLQFGYRDQFSYRIARRAAHTSVVALSSSVSNMLSEPKKYQAELEFAPSLLGLSYTLLSYISALATHRQSSGRINHHIDFCVPFFQQSKQIADLLEKLSLAPQEMTETIAKLNLQLSQLEQHYHDNEKALLLTQQLHLIAQLLPQLHNFVRMENSITKSQQ